MKLDPLTAHDLLVIELAAHLSSLTSGEKWIAIPEVVYREHRFDLVAARVSRPAERAVLAFEIKVSLPGIQDEIRTGKWRAMLDAGATPYLAIPESLRARARQMLPAELGLLVRRPDGRWEGHLNRGHVDRDSTELLLATFGAARREMLDALRYCQRIDLLECEVEPEDRAIPLLALA